MANKILAFLEQRDGKIKKSSLEAAKVGVELANKLNGEVTAVTVGNEIEDLGKTGNYGIKKVVHFKNEELKNYSSSAYSKIIADYANENDTDILLFANTSMGKDLAPFAAAKIDAGIAMDCVEVNVESDEITVSRPVYAGKALNDVKFNSSKKVITLRPNTFSLGEPSEDSAEVEVKEAADLDLRNKVVKVTKSDGKMDVAEAEIIVSGGRGLKEPDNFKLVEDLAKELNAAVGASRAVVDAGWRPHSEQVGQTGKTVSPNLYIAIGISGAIQHLAGMRSSKYIVAINKDKDAPIFTVADYGIAGDAFEVVPVLIEEIKKLNS